MQKKKGMDELVTMYSQYKKIWKDVEDAHELLRSEKNAEMIELLKEEISSGEKAIADMEEKLNILLIPKDPNDDRNIILEVRAGTGGEEAALFAGELANAYIIFAKSLGLTVEVLESSPSENKGMKEIIFQINGQGAYSKFKYE